MQFLEYRETLLYVVLSTYTEYRTIPDKDWCILCLVDTVMLLYYYIFCNSIIIIVHDNYLNNNYYAMDV